MGDAPVVVDGQVQIRKILSMTVSLDHYLVDAHEGLMATRYLRKLLSNPERLMNRPRVSGDSIY